MSTESNTTEHEQLRQMRKLITSSLYSALTDPDRPPKASMIQTAASWLRACGAVEDPDEQERQRAERVSASLRGLPFPAFDSDAEGRQKLADAVQHAVESIGDQSDDNESEDF